MSDVIKDREIDGLTESQQSKIVELVAEEVQKTVSTPSKNTIILVTACILITIAVIIFSMFYIAQLKQNVLINIEDAMKDVLISNTESISDSGSSDPDEVIKDTTVRIQLESANLLSADYLAVVLPILISLAGAFVVFLGMNRLKMYDERIDSTRADLLKELSTIVANQVAAGQTKQVETVKSALEKQQLQFNDSVNSAKNELENLKLKHKQEIEDAGSGFNWLKVTLQNNEIDLNIKTVADAHELVEQLRKEKPKNYTALIQEIVSRVCDATLSGRSADYHNLSAELARRNMYNEAIRVLNKGEPFFPNDTDILADQIHYATLGGMLNEAQTALDKLKRIPAKRWTWRGYIFASDYYRAVGNYDDALDMCNSAIVAIPLDEHAYHDKAEIIRIMNPGFAGLKQCMAVLEDAIKLGINCPQCTQMIGEIYLEMGKYQEALLAFDRTIQELAQEQPHVTDSYVFYNRAQCYDRLFMADQHAGGKDISLAVKAYQDYEVALALRGLSEVTIEQAKHRQAILVFYLPNSISSQLMISDEDTIKHNGEISLVDRLFNKKKRSI